MCSTQLPSMLYDNNVVYLSQLMDQYWHIIINYISYFIQVSYFPLMLFSGSKIQHITSHHSAFLSYFYCFLVFFFRLQLQACTTMPRSHSCFCTVRTSQTFLAFDDLDSLEAHRSDTLQDVLQFGFANVFLVIILQWLFLEKTTEVTSQAHHDLSRVHTTSTHHWWC